VDAENRPPYFSQSAVIMIKHDEQLSMRIIRNGASEVIRVQCRLRKLYTVTYCIYSILDIIRRSPFAICAVFSDSHHLGDNVTGSARI